MRTCDLYVYTTDSCHKQLHTVQKVQKFASKTKSEKRENRSSLYRLLLLLLLDDLDDRFRDRAVEFFLFLQNVPVGV